MAGGKETPRQKMISMMYLVLTALLALNVSSEVLNKFAFIDKSLTRSVNEGSSRNSQTVSSITSQVDDTGNREGDVKIVKAAEQIRKMTQSTLSELTEYKNTFVEITGGYEEGHEGDPTHIVGKTNYDIVGDYMIEKKLGGKGHGEELKVLLNKYATSLREVLSTVGIKKEEVTNFKNIALDANENPEFNHDPNQKGKLFGFLYFYNAPTGAGLATISEFQSQVSGYESRALDLLADEVGAGDLKFDKIVADVKAESKIVAAGAKYSAEMFVAASSSGVAPTMFHNGRQISVNDGKGIVEFIARPGKYDAEGLSRQTYEAKISVPRPGLPDTVFTNQIEYFVAKPVLQIQSASVQALYLNCGNELDVQVPALGSSYKPSFSAKGANVYPGRGGKVTVVPKSANVTLKVASNGNAVGSQAFKVRRIPKPEIKVIYRGRPVDLKKGIKGAPKSLQLIAQADESFQQFLPKDARFQVSGAEITLVRAGRGVRSVKASGKANLSSIANEARAGDMIVVEVKKVKRKNFRGEVEDFNNFGPRVISFSIH